MKIKELKEILNKYDENKSIDCIKNYLLILDIDEDIEKEKDEFFDSVDYFESPIYTIEDKICLK